jgi:hypothetical protein
VKKAGKTNCQKVFPSLSQTKNYLAIKASNPILPGFEQRDPWF